MQPFVSIVMPAYKVEKYISKSIESVLNQTYQSMELIIVDDGSPDQSGEIAEEYAKKDHRIRVIHQENGGLSAARNTGLLAAKGKYILFIDSDDYIEDNLLASVVYLAEKHNADVLMYGYYVDGMTAQDQTIYREEVCYEEGIYEHGDLKNIQLNANLLKMVGYAWNKLYKIQLLREKQFMFIKGLSLVEDIVFNLPVLSNVNKLIIIKKPLYHYVQRDRKTLMNMFHQNAFYLNKIGIKSNKKLFEEWGVDQIFLNRFIALEYMNAIRYCCANMFYYKNQLSLKEKYKYINCMLNDEFTRKISDSFHGSTLGDFVMKFIARYKMTILLMIIYSVNALKRQKTR